MSFVERSIELVLRLGAYGLLASMCAAAWHDVSRAWDVWYYHMPFAARIAGVVPRAEFVFHPANDARFAGLPLAAEFFQGCLWRLTGRPETANFVALASVPALAFFLRARFEVPFHVSVLALLAIPLVQLHATSCYVDLPANTAVAMLAMVTMSSYAMRSGPPARSVPFALAAATFAANTKALLHPIVLVLVLSLGVQCLRARKSSGDRWSAVLVAACLPVVFATPIKNALLHHNPYYPLRFSLLGHVFPGTDEPYSSAPRWLEHAPRPERFAASILELGLRPVTDPSRWSVDQWTPPTEPGYRMGGFFGAYVVVQLAVFALILARARSRPARAAGLGFAALTVLTAIMPQSHELRYYMYWMLVLVSMNLWLGRALGRRANLALGVLAGSALCVVLRVTRAEYVYPSGVTFSELVRERTDERKIATAGNGETVCVADEPYNLLWASRFHRAKDYVVMEAERPEDCGIVRRLSP